MNRSVAWLALCQGLLLTNNVVFIAVNGLVGLALAPWPWMATLPVMAYVVGGALATPLVAMTQRRWGRRRAFQLGLVVALLSAALCALAAYTQQFWLLCASTVVAGYYNANGQLYRFAAAELVELSQRERAISLVLAGGLLGAVLGPALASHAKGWLATPFLGVYLSLMVVALLGLVCMARVRFPDRPREAQVSGAGPSRTVAQLLAQPGFAVAVLCAAVSYGVMNLLMAATPLAMQVCGHAFADTAEVLQWHVVGMFAPGFFTGHLIKRWGVLPIMGLGVVINLACVGVALSGQSVDHFLWAMALLGLGWNFLFTGSTSLVMRYYGPAERDRAEAAMNFCVFAVMAATSLASGALATSGGWDWLNWGSLLALALSALALLGLARRGL